MIALLKRFFETVVGLYDAIRGVLPSLTVHIHYKEMHEHLPLYSVIRTLPTQLSDGENAGRSGFDQPQTNRDTLARTSLTQQLIFPTDPAVSDSVAETRFITAMSEGAEGEHEFTWRDVENT